MIVNCDDDDEVNLPLVTCPKLIPLHLGSVLFSLSSYFQEFVHRLVAFISGCQLVIRVTVGDRLQSSDRFPLVFCIASHRIGTPQQQDVYRRRRAVSITQFVTIFHLFSVILGDKDDFILNAILLLGINVTLIVNSMN